MRTRIFVNLLVPAFVMAIGVQQASAGAFDFTNLNGGVEGSLATGSVTTGGVTATAFNSTGGPILNTTTLWLRNVEGDHGLGICTISVETLAGCATNGGDFNELSNELSFEVLQLDRGVTSDGWTSLWLSSLDNNGGVGLEQGSIVWSNVADPNLVDPGVNAGIFTFTNGIFGGAVEGNLLPFVAGFDASARYLYFFAGDGEPFIGGDNDYLVWKGTTADPIPEPATLLLLGSGLAGAAVRARRRRT